MPVVTDIGHSLYKSGKDYDNQNDGSTSIPELSVGGAPPLTIEIPKQTINGIERIVDRVLVSVPAGDTVTVSGWDMKALPIVGLPASSADIYNGTNSFIVLTETTLIDLNRVRFDNPSAPTLRVWSSGTADVGLNFFASNTTVDTKFRTQTAYPPPVNDGLIMYFAPYYPPFFKEEVVTTFAAPNQAKVDYAKPLFGTLTQMSCAPGSGAGGTPVNYLVGPDTKPYFEMSNSARNVFFWTFNQPPFKPGGFTSFTIFQVIRNVTQEAGITGVLSGYGTGIPQTVGLLLTITGQNQIALALGGTTTGPYPAPIDFYNEVVYTGGYDPAAINIVAATYESSDIGSGDFSLYLNGRKLGTNNSPYNPNTGTSNDTFCVGGATNFTIYDKFARFHQYDYGLYNRVLNPYEMNLMFDFYKKKFQLAY